MDLLTLIKTETIIDSMADSLIVLNLERKIVGINQATIDLFEYKKEELLNSPITIIFPGSEALFIGKKIKELERKGPVRNYVAVCHAKSGSKLPISLSMAHLVDKEKKVTGIVCVSKDMREVKRNMQQLRDLATIADRTATIQREKAKELAELNERLEKASRAKSEFLVNMSHELRTPLNSVIGFSEVLLSKTFGGINEKQEEYLNDIADSGKHLLSLINDILDLSKVEAGREELHVREFDLANLMEESIALFQEKAVKYNLVLSLKMDEKIKNILADRRKIKQIIFNLMSNATKFTPAGGRIILQSKEEEEEYLISVADTGKGIAKENQEKIFEKFQQLDAGYKKKYAGTGVGLALVREFIHMHKGRVWVESELGKGANFIFSVPKDLDYKIFRIYMDEAFSQAMIEGLFLAFIMVKLRLQEGEKTEDVLINQIIEDIEQVINKALYRPEDKLFKLRYGYCAVVLGKTGRDSVEVVFDRVKEGIDKYILTRRMEERDLEVQMFTYPEEVTTEEQIIKKLNQFGLYK